MDENMETDFSSTMTDTKANLNYELLLGRAVDRCLHYRVADPMHTFLFAVRALDLALVNLPGKPLRSEFDEWVSHQGELGYPNWPHREGGELVFDDAFKMITSVLSKYHMLFRSTMIEINR